MSAAQSSPADETQVMRARATQTYAAQDRQGLDDKRILDFLPLVRHVVQKVAAQLSHKVDLDDLISAGTLGLVKAAKAFDTKRDVEFKTYAYIRIRGAVLDELRSRSFAPSAMHAQFRHVREVYRDLTAGAGTPPSDEELAAALGVELSDLYHLMEEARRQHFMSMHGMSDDEAALGSFMPADRGPSPVVEAERKELLEQLAKTLMQLPQRDRTVLLLYYERDLTMKEAAAVLGVTESRVSQLHASALFKLSMKMRSSP